MEDYDPEEEAKRQWVMGQVDVLFTVVPLGDLIRVREILSDPAFPRQTFFNLQSTMLHQAANNKHYQIIDYLLSIGAIVNSRDASLMTPLHVACNQGDVRTVQVLLGRGADVNCVDYENRTPLYFASYHGHLDCLKLILDHEAIDTSLIRQGGKWHLFYSGLYTRRCIC